MPNHRLRHAGSRTSSVLIEVLLVALVILGAMNLPDPAPPSYTARATVLLLPPSTDDISASLQGLVDVEIHTLTSPATRAHLRHLGVNGDYTVTPAAGDAPMLRIMMVDSSAQATIRGLRAVVAEVSSTLARLQNAAGLTTQLVRAVVLDVGTKATPVSWIRRLFGHRT